VRVSFYLFCGRARTIVAWAAAVLGHKDGLLHAATAYVPCDVVGLDKVSRRDAAPQQSAFHNAAALSPPAPPVPAARATGALGAAHPQVTVRDARATVILVDRAVRRNDGRTLDRVTACAETLRAMDVEPTRAVLKRIGFGSTIISQFKRADRSAFPS
jgi:hypothetical protein